MGTTWAPKDAARLADDHRLLLKQLNDLKQVTADCDNEIRKNVQSMFKQRVFEEILERELIRGDRMLHLPVVERFLRSLDGAHALEKVSLEARKLLEENEQFIGSAIRCVEKGADSVGWVFKRKEEKEAIWDAYQALVSLASGPYVDMIRALNEEVRRAKGKTGSELWRKFEDSPAYFREILEKYDPLVFGLHTAELVTKGLLNRIERNDQKLDGMLDYLAVSEKMIREIGGSIEGDWNPRSTALVGELYRYRQRLAIAEEIEEHELSNKKDIRKELEIVRSLESSLEWFFMTRQEKTKIRMAYNRLDKALSREYLEEGERLMNRMRSQRMISETESWNDFNANKNEYFNLLARIEG